jgi:hypothetical protein
MVAAVVCRRVAGQIEEVLLALHVLHAREGSDLRVAQLAFGERGPHERQRFKPPGDPDLLTCGTATPHWYETQCAHDRHPIPCRNAFACAVVART